MEKKRPGRPEFRERNLEMHRKFVNGYTVRDLGHIYSLHWTTVQKIVSRSRYPGQRKAKNQSSNASR